ncbi:MAG TPA: NAD-dependent epimerase/dehydratase family protein [Holophagaceae bacterium]
MTHSSDGTWLLAGCGYVGARLARRFAEPGLALVRTGASAAALARQGLPARAVDLDGGEPFPVPEALAAVAYLAPPAGLGGEDDRLRRFLANLGAARPEVFLYFSTTSVYGDTGGAPVDESAPAKPGDARARQRLDAETQVREWCAARDVRAVCFRVAAIYGPHRLPLDRLRRGEPVIRPEDTGPGNRVQVDDLVEAAVAALAGNTDGIFNLADGIAWSPAEFSDRVADAAGLPRPRRIAWAEAQHRFSEAYLAFFRERRQVVPGRLAELGLVPRPPEAGIRDSLRDMGLDGLGG